MGNVFSAQRAAWGLLWGRFVVPKFHISLLSPAWLHGDGERARYGYMQMGNGPIWLHADGEWAWYGCMGMENEPGKLHDGPKEGPGPT